MSTEKVMEIARWNTEKVIPSVIGLDIVGYTASNPDYNWFLIREGLILIMVATPKPPPIERNKTQLANLLGNTEV